MEKFKIGDRVQVVRKYDHIEIGYVGTVIEDSGFPCITWDKKSKNNYAYQGYDNVYGVHEDHLVEYNGSSNNYEIYLLWQKFKIGDRVTCTEEFDHIQVGDTGTVVEDSLSPWVTWDKYSEDNHYGSNIWGDNYYSARENWLELINKNTNYEIY